MNPHSQPSFFCLCMAPAIDATITLPREPYDGQVITGVVDEERIGGKGINVARYLALKGNEVVCSGLLGRDNATLFEAELRRFGIKDAFVRVDGLTRRNEYFAFGTRSFKLNRDAFPDLSPLAVSPEDIISRIPATTTVAVLSGSLPKTLPQDFYARLIRTIASRGIATVLDASGSALSEGVKASPDIIKPNQEESAAITGFIPHTLEDYRKACAILLERTKVAIITAGADGGYFASRDTGGAASLLHIPAPQVEVANTTGAGDTLLAHFLHLYFRQGYLTKEIAQQSIHAASLSTCDNHR